MGYNVNGGNSAMNEDSFCDLKLVGVPLTNGIVMELADTGATVTNVPHLVVHHSPTGFSFGYGGSGPADLALNIVEAVLRRMDYQGEKTRCFDGRCFTLAYRLHQEFKWEFVATARGMGAAIPYETVEAWIRERMITDGQSADQASGS
jgi:hypothetical protein